MTIPKAQGLFSTADDLYEFITSFSIEPAFSTLMDCPLGPGVAAAALRTNHLPLGHRGFEVILLMQVRI